MLYITCVILYNAPISDRINKKKYINYSKNNYMSVKIRTLYEYNTISKSSLKNSIT